MSSDKSTNIGRRRFLSKAAFATTGVVASAALLPGTTEKAFGQQGATSLGTQFKQLQLHENEHVVALVQALGANARPKPTFQNLQTNNISQFFTTSRALENTGVGAYLGATPAIDNPAILSAAGSIALIEARHAGFLNSLTSRPSTENLFSQVQTFERAFTIDEVLAAAGPFIASLNGGPALTFSNVRSPANDIAILNFALALEYLEAEFYNINVPLYYR